jgi:nucleotide-binding universal stress UspA family protein
MFDRILVPLDGSAAAEAALTIAEAIPSQRVRLLAVETEADELGAVCLSNRDCTTYLDAAGSTSRCCCVRAPATTSSRWTRR